MNCKTCGAKMAQMFFEHSYLCPNSCDKRTPGAQPVLSEDDPAPVRAAFAAWEGPAWEGQGMAVLNRGTVLKQVGSSGNYVQLNPSTVTVVVNGVPTELTLRAAPTYKGAGPIDKSPQAVISDKARIDKALIDWADSWEDSDSAQACDWDDSLTAQGAQEVHLMGDGIDPKWAHSVVIGGRPPKDTELISTIQQLAIKNLLTFKQITLEQVLMALSGHELSEGRVNALITGDRFRSDRGINVSLASRLTRLEAIAVIRYLNTGCLSL